MRVRLGDDIILSNTSVLNISIGLSGFQQAFGGTHHKRFHGGGIIGGIKDKFLDEIN